MTTTYVYDGADIVLQIEDNGTTTTATHYINGPGIDEPLALVRGGQSYYYHPDGLGSIVTITNSSRYLVQQYHYEAYGQPTLLYPFGNSYAYTGREWDEELGLYYYRARYYDPLEGRFISKDPIGFAGGDVNVYRYVGNNSINFIDPLGLFDWGVGGIVGFLNFEWNSSQRTKTNVSIVTDLELGGGFKFCFDHPFKKKIEACGREVPELPFDINIGLGKYTGISTNNKKLCINLGLSAGFTPVDFSIPVN